MSERKMTIGFTYKSPYGNEYHNESTVSMHQMSELETIGEQLNAFLTQIGFVREGGYILMEDLTEDEYDELYDHLYKIRGERSKDGVID